MCPPAQATASAPSASWTVGQWPGSPPNSWGAGHVNQLLPLLREAAGRRSPPDPRVLPGSLPASASLSRVQAPFDGPDSSRQSLSVNSARPPPGAPHASGAQAEVSGSPSPGGVGPLLRKKTDPGCGAATRGRHFVWGFFCFL